MATIQINLTCELQEAVKVRYLDGNLFSQDNQGNQINITVFDNGEPATLGGSVTANVLLSDGSTVPATGGTITGNVVSITLPAAAYAVPGLASIIVKLTADGVITTIAAVVANVYQSSTDTVIDPGTIIPSIQDLIDDIETAVASIPADYSSLWTSLAPAFSSSTSYVAGQYVTYNGSLYRFSTVHSGSWSSSDVTAVNIGSDLFDLKNASLKVIGQIASTVTALSTLTEPGMYFIPKSYVSNLTDKPSGASTSNNYALIVWYSAGQKVQQILVDWGGTDMWKRHKTTTSFVEWAKLTNNAETQAIIYTAAQSLNASQKAQALSNIGTLGADEIFTMRGDVASGTTVLSTFTTPGVYQIPRGNIGSLTDLPDNYETNRNTMLMVYRTDDTTVWQLLVEKEPGYLWVRSINTSTPTVGTWSEIGNTRYLAQANSTGDANSLSWTGFYGWGSTETITNVPTGMNVGMLLNVVRSATVKYQMAFDYFSNNVYTRHNQSGTWSSWERLAMMSDVTRKTVMFYYETRSSSQVPAKLHVYIPASTGYIHYELTRFIIDSKNCDVWRVSFVYRCDDNFENDSELTIAGEWECAIHNHPEDTDLDFSGGSTHGDEVLTDDPVFLIDGVPVTISGYSTMTACKELRIFRTSTMYDSADSTTEIADHGVEYVFTEDGLTISQSLKWKVATNLYRCFLCMYTPSKVNIDRAVGNADFAVMELPTDTTVKNYTITKAGSTAVTMWDTATGWFSEVSVPVYPTGLVGGDEMWVKDNNNDYNKVYFVVSAGGSVSVGDLWKSTSVYKIDYKAPAV